MRHFDAWLGVALYWPFGLFAEVVGYLRWGRSGWLMYRERNAEMRRLLLRRRYLR